MRLGHISSDPVFCPWLGKTSSGKDIRACKWDRHSFVAHHRTWGIADFKDAWQIIEDMFTADELEAGKEWTLYLYQMARIYEAMEVLYRGTPYGTSHPRKQEILRDVDERIKEAQNYYNGFIRWWHGGKKRTP